MILIFQMLAYYTNRVLRNTLNERQKEQIVEAISKSDSLNEAERYSIRFSTVQSAPMDNH